MNHVLANRCLDTWRGGESRPNVADEMQLVPGIFAQGKAHLLRVPRQNWARDEFTSSFELMDDRRILAIAGGSNLQVDSFGLDSGDSKFPPCICGFAVIADRSNPPLRSIEKNNADGI